MSFRVASISTLRRLRARAADVAKEQDAPRTASCRSRSRAGTRRAVAGPTSRRPADGDAQRGSRRHGARDERLEKRPVNNSRQSAPGSSDPALQTDAVGAGGEQDSARSLGRDLGDPLWVGLVLGNRDRHSITPGHRGSGYRTIGVRWGGVFPVFSLRTSTNRHMGVQPTRLSVLAPFLTDSRGSNPVIAQWLQDHWQPISAVRAAIYPLTSPTRRRANSQPFMQPAEAERSKRRRGAPDRRGPAASAYRAATPSIPPTRSATSSSVSATGSTCSVRRVLPAR